MDLDKGRFVPPEGADVTAKELDHAANALMQKAVEPDVFKDRQEARRFCASVVVIQDTAKTFRDSSLKGSPRMRLQIAFKQLREDYGTIPELHKLMDDFARAIEGFDPDKKLRLASLPRV